MRQPPFSPKFGLLRWVITTLGCSASIALGWTSYAAYAVNPPQSTPNPQPQEAPRFTCEFVDGEYSVMYHPESQPGQAYAWATPGTMGGGWTPERRCNEISRRLEFYRPDGLLEMRTSVENSYNIICVTTQKNPDCQIVLTVPPGQDPQVTRDRVFENLTVADSGQTTDAVPTFTGEDGEWVNQVLNEGLSVLGIGKTPTQHSNFINLRPFLDPADGGTGTQLHPSPRQPNPRLNPNNFR